MYIYIYISNLRLRVPFVIETAVFSFSSSDHLILQSDTKHLCVINMLTFSLKILAHDTLHNEYKILGEIVSAISNLYI